MLNTHLHLLMVLFVFVGNMFFPVLGYPGGPFEVNNDGIPRVWDTRSPVSFHTDQGSLGLLNNEEAVALVQAAFQVWEEVPSASVTFTPAGKLPIDVVGENVFEVVDVVGDGISPIVFDHDGTVTDALLGIGASRFVLGFTSIELGNGDEIFEALAILNGTVIDGNLNSRNVPIESFFATIVHEFGHYINLDHSQVNLELAFDNDPSNDEGIPTMFPLALDNDSKVSLHLDDIATISTLYPQPTFLTSTGTISGEVLLGDGVTPFQGANVIARNTSDPIHDAISAVSGALFLNNLGGGSDDSSLEGAYVISGLPSGNYTVEVEPVSQRFTGGSSVNPLDPPAIFPASREFYNGEDESGLIELDLPDDKTEIVVLKEESVEGIDILLNTLEPDDTDIGIALALTKFKHKIKESFDRVIARLHVTTVESIFSTVPTLIEMWVSDDESLDRDIDSLIAVDEIKVERSFLEDAARVKFKFDASEDLDGKFAIFSIQNSLENEVQRKLRNNVVKMIGGRNCTKDSFRREEEPNNQLGDEQSIGKLGIDECMTIDGVLVSSNDGAFDEDLFKLTVKVPAIFTTTLTHTVRGNFDSFVFGPDGQEGVCRERFGEEVCVLEISEGNNTRIDIVIASFRGEGEYRLDIQAFDLDSR